MKDCMAKNMSNILQVMNNTETGANLTQEL